MITWEGGAYAKMITFEWHVLKNEETSYFIFCNCRNNNISLYFISSKCKCPKQRSTSSCESGRAAIPDTITRWIQNTWEFYTGRKKVRHGLGPHFNKKGISFKTAQPWAKEKLMSSRKKVGTWPLSFVSYKANRKNSC